MRPASGRTSPARHCSVRVLPAPDGPKSATTPSPALHSTSSVKPGSDLRMRDLEPARHAARAPRRLADDQHEAGQRGEHRHQAERLAALARLHRGVDGERHGRGPARDVARQHQGGAELAERAREGEHEPGQDPVAGQRQRHLERGAQLRAAEGVGRALEIAVHRLDGRAHRAHQERQRHHGGRDHRRVPGEGHRPAGQPRRAARRARRAGPAARSGSSPTTVGGRTSGSVTSRSTRLLPQKRRRAST